MLTGVISFFGLLLICVLIRPIGLIVNSGISYYGNFSETLLPYSLAFILNSYLLWQASSVIGNKTWADRYIRVGLRVVAVLMIGILITPHNALNLEISNSLHKTIGTLLFGLQFIMAIMMMIIYRAWTNILIFALLIVSGFAAIVYLIQPTGFMIEAQIV